MYMKISVFPHFRISIFSSLLFAALTAAGAPGLVVKATTPFVNYVKDEAIILSVSIENTGLAAYIIDDYAPYDQNAVALFVRDSRGRLMLPKSDKPAVAEATLKSGESETFQVDATEFFDFSEEGHYQITVEVKRGAESAYSHTLPLTIVPGIRIKAVRRATITGGEVEYQLLYWARNEKEHLFIRIKDAAANGAVLGFAHLGTVVRVSEPTIEFSGSDIFVTHQYDRDRYTRTKLVMLSGALHVSEAEPMTSVLSINEATANRAALEKLADLQANKPKENKKPFVTPPKPASAPLGPKPKPKK